MKLGQGSPYWEGFLKYGRYFGGKNAYSGPLEPLKHCFRNAALLALGDEDLTYVEGYGTLKTNGGGVPLEHAWCVDARGRIYDPTWEQCAPCFGVSFKRDFLRKTLMRTEFYGLLGVPATARAIFTVFPEGRWHKPIPGKRFQAISEPDQRRVQKAVRAARRREP